VQLSPTARVRALLRQRVVASSSSSSSGGGQGSATWLVLDGSGDSLDAVLCLVQAAWASVRGWPLFGLPADMDRLEGWIVSARAEQPLT
jgi:hypothetical protein